MINNFRALDKAALEIIRSEYGLPYLIEGANLGGLSTLNFIIKADGKEFVLKKYQAEDINKIEKIEEIIFFLEEKNIPVIPPKKTIKGNYHLKFGNAIFVVYQKINGRILHEDSLAEKSLVNTAKLLQIVHGLDIHRTLSIKKNNLSLHEFLKNANECKKLILNLSSKFSRRRKGMDSG
jgi:Ser/Thr protein kinase RdoA (MazF antagonist)